MSFQTYFYSYNNNTTRDYNFNPIENFNIIQSIIKINDISNQINLNSNQLFESLNRALSATIEPWKYLNKLNVYLACGEFIRHI